MNENTENSDSSDACHVVEKKLLKDKIDQNLNQKNIVKEIIFPTYSLLKIAYKTSLLSKFSEFHFFYQFNSKTISIVL